MLTQAQIDVGYKAIDRIYAESQAHVKGQWHAPFSGQPQEDLGALRIAHDDGLRALRDTEKDPSRWEPRPSGAPGWLGLADTVEDSMRAIAHYDDGASVREEISYVATTPPTTGPLAGLPSIRTMVIGALAIVALAALTPLIVAIISAHRATA